MKKVFLAGLLLLSALVAGAQNATKIALKLAKGDKVTYVTELKTKVPNAKEVTVTSETDYVVTDVTADGYVIDITQTSCKSDADASDVVAKLTALGEQVANGVLLRVATDKDGKPVKLQNADEVKTKGGEAAAAVLDELLQSVPGLEQVVPKDVLKTQLLEAVSEENVLRSLQNGTSVLGLNGKTISVGAQDEYTAGPGIKMKRLYFPNGKTLVTNATLNMTADEIKQLILDQIVKLAPGQADMIKQNIDIILASGAMKIDGSEKVTYEFFDNGWVKSLTGENTMESMGQKTSSTVVITCKEHSWK